MDLQIATCWLSQMKTTQFEVSFEVRDVLMTVRLKPLILEIEHIIDLLQRLLVKAISINFKRLINTDLTTNHQHFNMRKIWTVTRTTKQKNFPTCLKWLNELIKFLALFKESIVLALECFKNVLRRTKRSTHQLI